MILEGYIKYFGKEDKEYNQNIVFKRVTTLCSRIRER